MGRTSWILLALLLSGGGCAGSDDEAGAGTDAPPSADAAHLADGPPIPDGFPANDGEGLPLRDGGDPPLPDGLLPPLDGGLPTCAGNADCGTGSCCAAPGLCLPGEVDDLGRCCPTGLPDCL